MAKFAMPIAAVMVPVCMQSFAAFADDVPTLDFNKELSRRRAGLSGGRRWGWLRRAAGSGVAPRTSTAPTSKGLYRAR